MIGVFSFTPLTFIPAAVIFIFNKFGDVISSVLILPVIPDNTSKEPENIVFPVTPNEPDTSKIPVTLIGFVEKVPILIGVPIPVFILIFCVLSVVIIKSLLPRFVKLFAPTEPVTNNEPEIVWLPLKVFEPVIARPISFIERDTG